MFTSVISPNHHDNSRNGANKIDYKYLSDTPTKRRACPMLASTMQFSTNDQHRTPTSHKDQPDHGPEGPKPKENRPTTKSGRPDPPGPNSMHPTPNTPKHFPNPPKKTVLTLKCTRRRHVDDSTHEQPTSSLGNTGRHYQRNQTVPKAP